jgi:F0F1-type ATP synthase delta subunit
MKKREIINVTRALLRTLAEVPEKEQKAATQACLKELKRLHKLPESAAFMRAIERMWSDVFGPKSLSIVTAHRIPVVLKEKLGEAFPGAEIKSVIDPRLIGGATLRLDDRIIDSSVLGTLERMKKALLAH